MYASYDEWTYCTPVMMSGPIVRQLCEQRNRETNKDFEDEFHSFTLKKKKLRCRFTAIAKDSRHASCPFGGNSS